MHDDIGLAGVARRAALDDAQSTSECLLEAEARLGEMLAARPSQVRTSRGGSPKPLPEGVSQKDSHRAQQIFRNRDVVRECVDKARERGDIATPRAVLKQIRQAHQWFSPGNHWRVTWQGIRQASTEGSLVELRRIHFPPPGGDRRESIMHWLPPEEGSAP